MNRPAAAAKNRRYRHRKLFALAIPYRLQRCSPGDLAALHTFLDAWFAPFELDGYSNALDVNISFSEYWETPSQSPDGFRRIVKGRIERRCLSGSEVPDQLSRGNFAIRSAELFQEFTVCRRLRL